MINIPLSAHIPYKINQSLVFEIFFPVAPTAVMIVEINGAVIFIEDILY